MSTKEPGAESPLIDSYDDLVGWIAAGEKPEPDWRIGTEHEKFVFRTSDKSPVAYEGNDGICALMQALIDEFAWQPIKEGETIIALKRSNGPRLNSYGERFKKPADGCALKNKYGVYTRVSAYRDWIARVVADQGN